MTWTHEPPNDLPTDGAWFWCRRQRGDLRPRIVLCYRHYKGYTAIATHPMDERDVKTLDYEWAGPIPEPNSE